MKRYEVWVRETLEYKVEVEAKDAEDALREAEEEASEWPVHLTGPQLNQLKHIEIEALSAEAIKDD